MRIVFIGTGTSTGVPMVGCRCEVCRSSDRRDRRLRTSLWMELDGYHLIIDSGIDLRQQMIKYQIPTVDAILFTHHHVDHIFGLDEIRPVNFLQRKTVDIHASAHTIEHLKRIYPYIFNGEPCLSDIPKIRHHLFENSEFLVHNQLVVPIPLLHGDLPIAGFRIHNFAYCTDVSQIPETSYDLLTGLDVLVLGALRERPHPHHFTLQQAVKEAEKIKAERTYLIHISHELGHQYLLQKLPAGIEPSYDGMVLDLPGV